MIKKYKIPFIYNRYQIEDYEEFPTIIFPFIRIQYPDCCGVEIFCRFPEYFDAESIEDFLIKIEEFEDYGNVEAVIDIYRQFIEYYLNTSLTSVVEMIFNPKQQYFIDIVSNMKIHNRTMFMDSFKSTDGDRELTKFTFKRNDY